MRPLQELMAVASLHEDAMAEKLSCSAMVKNSVSVETSQMGDVPLCSEVAKGTLSGSIPSISTTADVPLCSSVIKATTLSPEFPPEKKFDSSVPLCSSVVTSSLPSKESTGRNKSVAELPVPIVTGLEGTVSPHNPKSLSAPTSPPNRPLCGSPISPSSPHPGGPGLNHHPQPSRKSSFIHKLRESAKEVVNSASRHRSSSPATANGAALNSSSTRSNSPTSTPPSSSGLPPSAYAGSDAYANSNHVTSHGMFQPVGASSVAPSHGDASPVPTMERKASFREIMAKTLSFGRSKSGHGAIPHGTDAHPPTPTSSSNTLLDKYGVCDKNCIGKGATAIVKLVHKLEKESNEEQLFAVKEFRKRRKNETEREYIKKLTSEFCISSSLHHINVVETIDLVQDEHEHWCEVMEYCAGGDLYSVIKNGKMTRSEIDCCFKQLIHGVAYLHNNGVAHRDIKPEVRFCIVAREWGSVTNVRRGCDRIYF
jgi:serine/threonine protein kinase